MSREDAPAPGVRSPTSDGALDAAAPGRRSFLIRGSALVGASLLPGLAACGGNGEDAPPAPAPPPPEPAPPSDPPPPPDPPETGDVQAEVSFRALDTAARLDSRYAGLSYEKTKLTVPMFTTDNAALIQLFRLLGPSVLRIGANAVDRSSWQGAVQGLTPILPAQVDALAAFVQATECQVIYGVNLASNSPARAAEEAAYVAERLGPSLLAWEIGNEPDLYTRHGYRPDDWGYEDFLDEWREFRAAMSETSPGVAFSGPGTTFQLERNTLLFAHDEREHLGMLTHHYYRADRDDPSSTLALLLEPDPALMSELARLVRTASDEGIPLGARLTEANSFHGGGAPGISNAYASALWVMDFMFTCALAGCTGVNLHGGNRGSYTPVADRDGTVVEARPLFHGMVMFSEAAHGQPLQGTVTADAEINVSAWGVERDDNGLNAILINKDASRSVSMDLATGATATRFDPLWLRGTALSASTGQTLGGASIGKDGSWTPRPQEPVSAAEGRLQVLLPPASAVLLRSL